MRFTNAFILGLVVLISTDTALAQVPPAGGANRNPIAVAAGASGLGAGNLQQNDVRPQLAGPGPGVSPTVTTPGVAPPNVTTTGNSVTVTPSPSSILITSLADSLRTLSQQAASGKTAEERRSAIETMTQVVTTAQGVLDRNYRDQQDARWVGYAVLFAGAAVLGAILVADHFRKKEAWENAIYRLVGLTVIVIAAIFIVVAGYSETQIAPVMGLLGTALGYILGKENPSMQSANPGQVPPIVSGQPGTGTVTPATPSVTSGPGAVPPGVQGGTPSQGSVPGSRT